MLILVVWTITLLSVLAVGVGSRCAFALGLAERLEHQLRASYSAAAGVPQALSVLGTDLTASADGLSDTWADNEEAFARRPVGGSRFTISVPQAAPSTSPVRYGLIDQERFLNLNTTTPAMVKQLLRRVAPALKDLETTTIAESVVDWRDKDHDALPSGAEGFYYEGLSPSYECKDAPFESVEELLLIRGMTPGIFRRMRPYVTVYGSGAVNLNTADAVVLAALGLSPQGVSGLLEYRAGEDDVEGTDDDRLLTALTAVAVELKGHLPVEDAQRLATLAEQQLIDVKSTAFAVHSSADGGRAVRPVNVDAVVERDGRVLAWAEH